MGADQVSLHLKSIDEGLRFFNQVLGFKINFRFQYDGLRVVILEAGKARIEMWESGSGFGVKPWKQQDADHGDKPVALTVRRLRDRLRKARAFGYEILKDAYEPEGGIREALVRGPEDISVRLIEQDRIKAMKALIKRKLQELA